MAYTIKILFIFCLCFIYVFGLCAQTDSDYIINTKEFLIKINTSPLLLKVGDSIVIINTIKNISKKRLSTYFPFQRCIERKKIDVDCEYWWDTTDELSLAEGDGPHVHNRILIDEIILDEFKLQFNKHGNYRLQYQFYTVPREGDSRMIIHSEIYRYIKVE